MSEDLIQMPDLREYLAGNLVPEVEDPRVVQARIIEQVLRAENAEQLFDSGGSTALNQLVNVPFTLHDVRVMESKIEDALPVYVLLDVELRDSGDRIVVNTGAPRAMAQAWRAKELGLLPCFLQAVEVAKAEPGKSAPLGLAAL